MATSENHGEPKKTEKVNQAGPRDYYHRPYGGRRWLVPVLIAVIILLFIGLMSAFWWAGAGRYEVREYGPMRMMGVERGGYFGGGGGYRLPNSQNKVRGVVTAVNGSSFTVAADGSTTSVQTSSSTQYQGGSQVKVNDTVIAYGTTSGGTLNATQVVINP